jgi:hypothetical protein
MTVRARGVVTTQAQGGGRPLARAGRARSIVSLAGLRARESLVINMLFAFVLAFLVAPCLHTYDHRADHDHAPGGRRVSDGVSRGEAGQHQLAHALGRAHDHEVHGTVVIVVTPPAAAEGVEGGEVPSVPHGHGVFEHFGVAVASTPTFVLAPVELRAVELAAPLASKARPSSHQVRQHRPRGPPASGVVEPHRC